MHVGGSVQLLWVLWAGAIGLFGARLCGWMPEPDQARATTQLRKTNTKNKSNTTTTTTTTNNNNVPTTPGAATATTAGHHQQDSYEAPIITKNGVTAVRNDSLSKNARHPDGDDDDDGDDVWSCPVSRSSSSSSSSEGLHRHTPVVVFAQPRTGSNLLLDLLGRLGRSSSSSSVGGDVDRDDDVSVLPLFELLVADAMGFRRIADAVMSDKDSACSSDNADDGLTDDAARRQEWLDQLHEAAQSFAALSTIKQNENATLATAWQKELYRVLDNARSNPGDLFRFLNGIPSRSEHAFFACQIFKDQLDTLQRGVTTEDLVRSIVSLPGGGGRPPKFIILWRRNFLESYVSLVVAQRYGTRVRQDTDEHQSVKLDRQKFREYVATQQSYYATVRDALVANNVTNFAVLEYDRDLAEHNSRVETMQRVMVDLLGLSPSYDGSAAQNAATALVDQISRTKQAQVPIAKQVLNWEEVTTEWGYTGKAEDFEDIFAVRK